MDVERALRGRGEEEAAVLFEEEEDAWFSFSELDAVDVLDECDFVIDGDDSEAWTPAGSESGSDDAVMGKKPAKVAIKKRAYTSSCTSRRRGVPTLHTKKSIKEACAARLSACLRLPERLFRLVNEGDVEGIQSLVDEVFDKNCALKTHEVNVPTTGREYVSVFFSSLVDNFPDGVNKLRRAQLCKNGDVAFRFSFEGCFISTFSRSCLASPYELSSRKGKECMQKRLKEVFGGAAVCEGFHFDEGPASEEPADMPRFVAEIVGRMIFGASTPTRQLVRVLGLRVELKVRSLLCRATLC
jgi:hypothetical protein